MEKYLHSLEHHVTVLPANHVNVFCMRPTTNTQSHTKCTYMIDQEYSHEILPDHISLSRVSVPPSCIKVQCGCITLLLIIFERGFQDLALQISYLSVVCTVLHSEYFFGTYIVIIVIIIFEHGFQGLTQGI